MTSKSYSFLHFLTPVLIGAFLTTSGVHGAPASGELLANWRFEQVQHLDGSQTPAAVGESLTADERRAAEPQPFGFDDSGKGNFLQVRGPKPSTTVFSDNVPASTVDGKPNTRSLALKGREYFLTPDYPLAFSDMQKGWSIEASVMTNHPEYDQVFLCKEGPRGAAIADVSIGYDSMQRKFYAEVKGADGQPNRALAQGPAAAGKWYDIRAQAAYNPESGRTTLQVGVKPSGQASFGQTAAITFRGSALPRYAAQWTIGRGFPAGSPNTTVVSDGGIDEVRIHGEPLPRVPGQNPIFTDTFTADPAALVAGDTVYAYVGHDAAKVGGFFHMPEWLCYSSKDMKNWTPHGPVLKPADFAFGRPNTAWASQVIERNGKFYFYVTVDRTNGPGHSIAVAVADSPTGPFKDARGTPLITDDMTTDSRKNNVDIDPTVFIDDDKTVWMAWGNGDCYVVKLKPNMTELDGPIQKVSFTNYGEGPWLFKRGNLYYNVYAADVPGTGPEQIAYATAPKMTGPWTYRGVLTGPAKFGFTIHPAVIEFKGQWYFFYHDGSTTLNGMPGGDCRRSVCLEYLYFNPDGTIQPITQTTEGVSIPPAN
jgi:hypothetical protein